MKSRFAEFEFDRSTGELTRQGISIPLQPQPAKILAALTQRPGQVLSRKDLQNEVWDESTHVDSQQGLNWCIRRLREALDDSPSDSKFIQTLPKRGYRFIAEVQECNPEGPAKALKNSRITWCVAGLLFVATVMAVLWLSHRRESQVKHDITVLVLPFDNVSASQAGPEFQEIASDQLIGKLAEIDPKHLRVIDPLTARKFKNTKECIIEIGNSLGADYVVVGEVDPSLEAVRVHAQLFQVATNRQVWASEGELPRRFKYPTIWDSMSGAIGAQLLHEPALSN